MERSVYYVLMNDYVLRWTKDDIGVVYNYPYTPLTLSQFIDELILTERMDYDSQCLLESKKLTTALHHYLDTLLVTQSSRDMNYDYHLIERIGFAESYHPQSRSIYNHLHTIGSYWMFRALQLQRELSDTQRELRIANQKCSDLNL